MAAKLTFNDIENNELDPSKLNFPVGFSNALSSGTGAPSADAPVGGLYIDTSTGDTYRKTVTGAGAANWLKISAIATTIQQNRYRGLTINSAVTSTDATAPAIGDLVGYSGTGVWAASGNLNASRSTAVGGGIQTAAWVAGGGALISTELFNGSTWANSGNLAARHDQGAGSGGLNSALIVGGNGGSPFVRSAELFNGSAWAASALISISKGMMMGTGTQNATFVAGGETAGNSTREIEIFNGTTWTQGTVLPIAQEQGSAFGTLNCALVGGGFTTAVSPACYLFNGSSWVSTASMSVAKSNSSGFGSQSAGMLAGGGTGAYGAGPSPTTDLFNGSTWAAGANSTAKSVATNAGSQNAGLLTGGTTGGLSNSTDLYSQTTFRKVMAKNITDAKNIGVLSNTATVMIQGTNTSITYPANKYLILNRSLNAAVTNYTNVTALSFVSVLGTAPTMTYNLSATANLLAVLPGMIATITASGANPVSAGNAGSFVISRIINPSSFEIQNASGISQNPGTGTISIITTMLAVDYISPQDVVVGKTDAAGLLTIQRPLVTGTLLRRLK